MSGDEAAYSAGFRVLIEQTDDMQLRRHDVCCAIRPGHTVSVIVKARPGSNTRAHHRDEKPERDLTYHLTYLLIYQGTTTHLKFRNIFVSK